MARLLPKACSLFDLKKPCSSSRPCQLVDRRAERSGWEERSNPEPRTARRFAGEHGEDCEHRTFREVSTAARLIPVGLSGVGANELSYVT